MKKYLAVILLSVISLPMFALKAYSISDTECDNIPYEYFIVHSTKTAEPEHRQLKYLVGERNNRGKYKQEALDYCKETQYCPYSVDWENFFGNKPLEDAVEVNYPTFALFLNNKIIFEALIKEGGLDYLIDDGLYAAQYNYMNSYFETPALLAVRYSQVGILKYLLKNYDINLYRLSGYIYRSPNKPQEVMDAYGVHEFAKQYWKKKGITKGLQCAEMTKAVLDQYFKDHKKDADTYKEAVRIYNAQVKYWAEYYRVQALNNSPMRRGIDILDFMQPEPENYAENKEQELEEQIDSVKEQITEMNINILMQEIMNGFDLSVLGNKA